MMYKIPMDLSSDSQFLAYLQAEYRKYKAFLALAETKEIPLDDAMAATQPLILLTRYNYRSKTGETKPQTWTTLREYALSEVYLLAVGLLAFGDLTVAEDILDNIRPMPDYYVSRIPADIALAGRMSSLLPLPHGMDALKDAEAVRNWIQANRSHLRWVGECYVLDR